MADDVLTPADIARLAGVGRAAVSNWRARHKDFPRQVAGTTTSPLFSRTEVEAWLAGRGRTLDSTLRAAPRAAGAAGLVEVVASLLPPHPPDVVLDPACGSGAMLVAAARRYGAGPSYVGQDPDRAELDAARRALREADIPGSGLVVGSPADDDGLSGYRRSADVVVCLPPARASWDEETLDLPWEFGPPSQLDPYLAWLQICYGYLKPGGVAVVAMTPAAAVRASGRRVRSEMLRAGALRQVVALPERFAADLSGSWQIWVLRRPAGRPEYTVRMVDLTGLRREDVPADEASWRKVYRDPATSRDVEGIELLDEDVLLLPSRHVEAPVRDVGPEYDKLRAELAKAANALDVRLPSLPRGKGPVPTTLVSITDLVKLGAVLFLDKGATVRPGDVIVPTGAGRFDAYVVGEDGRHGSGEVLRCDHATLDPHFLACFLRSETNRRHASGTQGGTSRLDVRRARIPRLPLSDQRPYGEAFRLLTGVTDRIEQVSALAADAVQKAVYGLTSGVLGPPRNTPRAGRQP